MTQVKGVAQTCLMNAFFFGYGSLVNTATHSYAGQFPATAHGWQRAWRCVAGRKATFLTVIEAPDMSIDGLVAEVPGRDWRALDAREASYDRLDARHCIGSGALTDVRELAIYAIPPDTFAPPSAESPILLSYIDVVMQGYLKVFGRSGAEMFVETTTGWNTPILDDRRTPVYPRHQRLSAIESSFVDGVLREVGADILDVTQPC